MVDVEIAFDGERDHALAATLANFAERFKRSRHSDTCFLHKFAAGSDLGVLALIHLALRNRPGPFVLFTPIGSARMHQQDFEFRTDTPVHQDARARNGSAS